MLLFISLQAQADHIVGGYINMESLGKGSDDYRFTLGLYINDTRFLNNEENLMTTERYIIRIYQKNGDMLKQDIQVFYQGYENVFFNNPTCEQVLGLSTRLYSYAAEITLRRRDYDDAGGYYVAFERCCRQAELVNIINPSETGMVMYTEFPSLREYPDYSAPVFNIQPGDFVCRRTLLNYTINVREVDGDSIKFSLYTPIKGSKTPSTAKNFTLAGPYPPIDWKPPYNESRMIFGLPSLTVDAKSGTLTANTSDAGMYAFAVKVEKFRNNKSIGFSIIDFQLLVAPCSSATPPKPVITYEQNTVSEVEKCVGQRITLEAGPYDDYSYQWYKNDTLLRGETANRIQVDSTAIYHVVRNFATICGNVSKSNPVEVRNLGTIAPEISVINSASSCAGDTIELAVKAQTGLSYDWKVGNQSILGTETIKINQVDTVRVRGRQNSAGCLTPETVYVPFFQEIPTIPTGFQTKYSFCTGESILIGINTPAGLAISWLKDGAELPDSTATIRVQQAGTYLLRLTNNAGCQTVSDSIFVSENPEPSVNIENIDPICVYEQRINLEAEPAGGTFLGRGVTGEMFDPQEAGVGNHVIMYNYASSAQCKNTDTIRIAVIARPSISLIDEAFVSPGTPYVLPLNVEDSKVSVMWTPATWLDNPTLLQPTTIPLDNITYKAVVTNETGCTQSDSILIKVNNPLVIPNAFTPNGDGLNETWDITGLGNYPDIEIEVYNAWGVKVYYGQLDSPFWDGYYQGKRLPMGFYVYQLITNKNDAVFKGTVRILD